MRVEQFKENVLTMAIRNLNFLVKCETTEEIELLKIHTFHIVKIARKLHMFWLCHKLLDEFSNNVRKIFLKNIDKNTKTLDKIK